MIDGGYYESIYLTIITIYTIILSNKYSHYPNSRLSQKSVSSKVPSIILTVFLIIFIGCRPLHSAFVDMWNYTDSYYRHIGKPFSYDSNDNNLIFGNGFRYLSSRSIDIVIFFLIMATIYFGGLYKACCKLFPKDTLYAIIIYLAAFSTFAYGTNGIKAGAAASIFLLALGFYDKKAICAILLWISLGFHHSMIMPISALIICFVYKNPKLYLAVWFISLLIAYAHIGYFQTLFQGLADEKGAEYLSLDSTQSGGFYTGFRPDFIVYSAFPIYIGYWAIFKEKYSSKFYNLIYCTYLLSNSIWMLCMYASFTNRIAYLSWFMLPIVLVYPFFDKQFVINQYKKLNIVAWGHLGFTLFMNIVYYGFIK
ncbi:MAG: hypothetical protein HDS43_00435 [Bacteroides sp.]|nr:hypothetical protein [Bacteroides sp.]